MGRRRLAKCRASKNPEIVLIQIFRALFWSEQFHFKLAIKGNLVDIELGGRKSYNLFGFTVGFSLFGALPRLLSPDGKFPP